MPTIDRAAAIAAVCALAACAVGPDYTRPPMDLPAGWRIGPAEAAEISNAAWWDAFQDPALSKLLAEAIAGSLDLKAAAARVDEARARQSHDVPGAVDLAGEAELQQLRPVSEREL